jgi:hypothetical protein
MNLSSHSHPVCREAVFELPSEASPRAVSRLADAKKGNFRSSGRKAGMILAAALAVLPGFIPEPAVAANDLYISGGGGGGAGSSARGGEGGSYAGSGGPGSSSGGSGSGGGGAYVGKGDDDLDNKGETPTGGPGGKGNLHSDAVSTDATVTASNGTDGTNEAKGTGGAGGNAFVKTVVEHDEYKNIYIEAGTGGNNSGGASGGTGGNATLEAGGDLKVEEKLEITGGNGSSGNGGNANLDVNGDLNVGDTLTIKSDMGGNGTNESGGGDGDISTGGAGGAVTFTVKGDLKVEKTLTITSGNGGDGGTGNTKSTSITPTAGGAGGSVAFMVEGALSVKNSLTLTRGANGIKGYDDTAVGGAGGAGGELAVKVGTLNMTNENTTLILNGTSAWDEAGKTGVLFNNIDISGGQTLTVTRTNGDYSFNTLNVHGKKGVTATYADSNGPLDAAGKTLNFYLPQDIADGDTLLTVEGEAKISGKTDIQLILDGNLTALNPNEAINLIEAGTLTVDGNIPTSVQTQKKVGATVTYTYDFTLEANPQGSDGVLLATYSSSSGSGNHGGGDNGNNDNENINNGGGSKGPAVTIDPRAKAFPESKLAGTALLNQGVDFLIGHGIAAALRAGPENAAPHSGLDTFAVVGGGRLRHKTGSHVDLDGTTLIAGLSFTRAIQAGELTLGAFFEHGEGDYDTRNDFANAASVHGTGEVDYNGGGFIAHWQFNETEQGHFYAEASARAGLIDSDFKTRDLFNSSGQRAAYESRVDYEGAHAGVGYVARLNERATLELHGQYLWTRQGADAIRLSTGEPAKLKFQAVDSHRTRLGARWSQAIGTNARLTLGAAWEHEYDGEAKASILGQPVERPKLKGDTALVEARFILTPTRTQPLTLELGVQNHSGRREGVTGSFWVDYRF